MIGTLTLPSGISWFVSKIRMEGLQESGDWPSLGGTWERVEVSIGVGDFRKREPLVGGEVEEVVG